MDNCIEWQKARTNGGYGVKRINYIKYYAHRLAYAAHHNIPISEIKGKEVIHICDNPPCVNPEHLRLGSHLDNMLDMQSKGRKQRGERHWNSKLTETDIRAIRAAYDGGYRYPRKLAKQFNVNKGTIAKIVNKHRWAWL